jgi:protein-disulfide isomerase
MSKKGREASRRVKEMQAAQRRAEQRRRNLVVGGVAVAVIAAVVGIGIAIQSNRDTTGPVAVPTGTVDKYGIARGDASAPVTMDLYEDFQCPICKEYEGFLGDTITKNVDAGTLRVVYHPMAFLDEYSSRALETAACVLDEDGPAAYLKLHDLLYQNQPSESGPWPPDAELASLAAQAGADQAAVESCQTADTYTGWVGAATDAASKAHVTATPTMLIDGKDVPITEQPDQQGAIDLLQSTIDAAANASGSPAPSSGGSSSSG